MVAQEATPLPDPAPIAETPVVAPEAPVTEVQAVPPVAAEVTNPAKPAVSRKPVSEARKAPAAEAQATPVNGETQSPTASEAPVPTPVLAPAAAPAPVVATEPATDLNEDLPLIAGGAGAAALALLGTGLFVGRRRRRANEERLVTSSDIDQPARFAATDQSSERSAFSWGNRGEVPSSSAVTSRALPAGFETSRFGRHVQAAYRGPSPDNPSLSLKKRIKRAAFFDLRERQAATRSGGGVTANPGLVPA